MGCQSWLYSLCRGPTEHPQSQASCLHSPSRLRECSPSPAPHSSGTSFVQTKNILGSPEGARMAALLVTTVPIHPFAHSLIHWYTENSLSSSVCSQHRGGTADPKPLPSQCQGQAFLWEVELDRQHQGQRSRYFTCSAHGPAFIMGPRETGNFLARGQASWKPLAGTWGRRMDLRQYSNNWPSWPSCCKPHKDPVVGGTLCHMILPHPISADPLGWTLGGPWPTTQPPPNSQPPGSRLNTLKQSKSNYHEQAAWEHLLHASLGIANVPARNADRRWAPPVSRIARCFCARAPPPRPAAQHREAAQPVFPALPAQLSLTAISRKIITPRSHTYGTSYLQNIYFNTCQGLRGL